MMQWECSSAKNIPFSHLIYHRLKKLGARFPQLETLLPIAGGFASQLHIPTMTGERIFQHTTGYSSITYTWNLVNYSILQHTIVYPSIQYTCKLVNYSILQYTSAGRTRLSFTHCNWHNQKLVKITLMFLQWYPIPKFYIFLMGWVRGWVMEFPPCFFTFWGVEYDRPSVNPFFVFRRKFLLLVTGRLS